MDEMTPRERLKAVARFGRPDRLPLCEWAGIEDEAILHWIKKGVPIEKVVGQSEYFVRGELSSVSSLLMRWA